MKKPSKTSDEHSGDLIREIVEKMFNESIDKRLDNIVKEGSISINVTNIKNFFYGGAQMTNTKTTYSSKVSDSRGVAVAQGTKARASSRLKTNSALKDIDKKALLEQLAELRRAMKTEGTDVEHDIALSAIATAEKATKDGDETGMVSNLKKAGSWALGLTQKLALSVAEDAIKKATGI